MATKAGSEVKDRRGSGPNADFNTPRMAALKMDNSGNL